MDDRLERLESSVRDLDQSVREIEERLARLEESIRIEPAAADRSFPKPLPVDQTETPQPAVPEASPTDAAHLALEPVAPVLALVGRSVLILGGAFLVRMLTETGAIPPRAGVALGLVYAVAWLALADRSAARGSSLGGTFLGLTSLLIACPLLWEATTRFHAISPTVAFVLLAVVVTLSLQIAVRRGLRTLAWAGTLLPIATALGFFSAANALTPLCLFLIVLGVATSALPALGAFSGQRWAAAAVADVAVLAAVELVSRRDGIPEAYGDLRASTVLALALLLPAAYLCAFAFRSAVQRRSPGLFEGIQSSAAIAVGFGGALHLSHGLPAEPRLAMAGAILGAVAYLSAFALVERRPLETGTFLYLSTLAALLILLSTGPTLPGPPAPLVRNALAIFTAGAAVRFRRKALGIHSAVFLAAATAVSGFFQTSLACFLSPRLPSAVPGEVLREAVAAGAVYAILALGLRAESEKWSARLPAAFALALLLLGLGALVLVLAGRLSNVGNDPAALSAARTAVMSATSVGLALAARKARRVELRWLAWGILAATAVKILAQDLPSGRASTLFFSFACYGAALIIAPRYLGRRRARLPGTGNDTQP